MADLDYQAIRRRDRDKVMGNRVTPARLWNKACHAYNVHLEPTEEARIGLSRAQAALAAAEPNLLVCPTVTLHISVAWLLAVHVDYGEPKSVLWQRHGEEWTAELARIAAGLAPFTLRYKWLVATESAVIAVATPSEPVQRLRDAIRETLALPEQTNNTARLVHTTLVRYPSALADPGRLLAAVDATCIDVPTAVDQLTVSEELVYPSLVTSTKARLTLRGTGESASQSAASPVTRQNVGSGGRTSEGRSRYGSSVAMTVAVGSVNPVKVQAARTAVETIFGSSATLAPVRVSSGAPDQPWGDAVTLAGARTRADAARCSVPDASIGLGIEAGLTERDGRVESMSWVVAVGEASSGERVVGESRTASYLLPIEIADLVRGSMSLGAATDAVFGGSGHSQSCGTVGPLTAGLIDRRSHYVSALILALIPFHSQNATLTFGPAS